MRKDKSYHVNKGLKGPIIVQTKGEIYMDFEINNRAPINRSDSEFLSRMMEDNYEEPMQSPGNIPYIPQNDDIQMYNSRYNMRPEPQKPHPQYQGNGVWGKPLAMVYSPIQIFRNIYDPEDALSHGTIFKELDFPWYPTACSGCNDNYRKDGMRRG